MSEALVAVVDRREIARPGAAAVALPEVIVDAGAGGRRAVPGVLRGRDRERRDAGGLRAAVERFLAGVYRNLDGLAQHFKHLGPAFRDGCCAWSAPPPRDVVDGDDGADHDQNGGQNQATWRGGVEGVFMKRDLTVQPACRRAGGTAGVRQRGSTRTALERDADRSGAAGKVVAGIPPNSA